MNDIIEPVRLALNNGWNFWDLDIPLETKIVKTTIDWDEEPSIDILVDTIRADIEGKTSGKVLGYLVNRLRDRTGLYILAWSTE